MVPTSVSRRLPTSFHEFLPGLLADLDQFSPSEWVCHSQTPHPTYWRVLPLRARGGDPKDWTPAGIHHPKLPYADTPLLARCPGARALLDSLPCEKNSVRYSGVPSKGSINRHTDQDSVGLKLGSQLRLHFPVTSHPDADLEIDGQPQHWRPGEGWWGDFSKPHSVQNTSPVFRVHLLVCAVANEWLLAQLSDADI